MSAQLNYSYDMAVGYEGLIADGRTRTVVTRQAEGAIRFGRFVCVGTDLDNQCRIPSSGPDINNFGRHLGFALATNAKEQNVLGIVQYDSGESVSVLKSGAVMIKSETVLNTLNEVYIRFQAKSQTYTLVFDASLVTGNQIDGLIDNVAITPVGFNTDNATTLSDLALVIANSNPNILSAVSNGTDTINITSVLDQSVTVSNFLVTGGASQAGITATETDAGKPTSDIGVVRNDDDGGTAELAAYLRCDKSAVAGGLATIEIEF